MTFQTDILLGFADVMHQNEDAEVQVWSELDANGQPRAGAQPADAVGIYLHVAPEGVDSVTLNEYTVSDDPAPADPVVGIQARISCTSRERVRAIETDLYALFQDRWGGMLGRVKLVKASRASGTNGGQDSAERLVRTENYYLTVYRPSPNRI